jgi:hypothetical protein
MHTTRHGTRLRLAISALKYDECVPLRIFLLDSCRRGKGRHRGHCCRCQGVWINCPHGLLQDDSEQLQILIGPTVHCKRTKLGAAYEARKVLKGNELCRAWPLRLTVRTDSCRTITGLTGYTLPRRQCRCALREEKIYLARASYSLRPALEVCSASLSCNGAPVLGLLRT